jgi:cobalt-zinc-cadmium efflux system membrane fusion protein
MKTNPLIGALVCAALVAGCHKEETPAPPPEAKVTGETIAFPADSPQLASVSAEAAAPLKLSVTHMTGRLLWNDDATVRVFSPVTGRVTGILATLGQEVSAGTPLARIDSSDFGQAVADARTAEGSLRLAERLLNRSKELLEHGAAAQKDLDNAEAGFVSATSERDRSAARLALYGGNASGTAAYLLRTPLAGVVVEKNINPGQEIRLDQMLANAAPLFSPLFVVSDPSELWVQLDLSELDIASVRVGQDIRIHSRAYPDRIFEGRLESIGDALDPATRAVKVRGVAHNPDKLLKAEMYVTVDVLTESGRSAAAGVEIPAKAVFLKDNQSYLFIEESPGRFERKPVKAGRESDGKTLILDGVTVGQKVVTEGCLLLEAMLESTDKS